MSPYVFKHYHNPNVDYAPRRQDYDSDYDSDYDYDYRKRRKDYNLYDEWVRRNGDVDSLYGELVYDYETIYTTRTYSPRPRRRRHHRHHHRQYHHQPQPQPPRPSPRQKAVQYEHHYPHIHYTSPKSEPPVRYGGGYQPQKMEVTMLRPQPELNSEPRIALYKKRHRKTKDPYCTCHACPEKSSKTIPSMHYDELRCEHCAARVQPAQEEILAYPWTVISYRPSLKAPNSLPPLHFNDFTGSEVQQTDTKKTAPSKVSKPPPSKPQERKPKTQQQKSKAQRAQESLVDDKENQSLVAHTQPLFRSNNQIPSRPLSRTNVSYVKRHEGSYVRSEQSYVSQRKALSRVNNDFDDDVRPIDSISNVELPPLRAQSNSLIRSEYRPREKIRAETDVDANYTRQKYFQSLESRQQQQQQQEPQQQQLQQHQPALAGDKGPYPTPRPARDTASQISRMLKGEYYDRQNGQTYTYNINFGPRSLAADRRPNR